MNEIMEFEELQEMWLQYDKRILENTQINKEVLRKIISSRTEKRMNWIQFKAGFTTIAQIIVIGLFISKMRLRNEFDFYIGALILGILAIVALYWSMRYYFLIAKSDFSKSIALIKKEVKELEKYKLRATKFGYILSPFALIGTVFIIGIPILSQNFIYPILLIIAVFLISLYYTFKHSIFEDFKKINVELDEIRQLGKD